MLGHVGVHQHVGSPREVERRAHHSIDAVHGTDMLDTGSPGVNPQQAGKTTLFERGEQATLAATDIEDPLRGAYMPGQDLSLGSEALALACRAHQVLRSGLFLFGFFMISTIETLLHHKLGAHAHDHSHCDLLDRLVEISHHGSRHSPLEVDHSQRPVGVEQAHHPAIGRKCTTKKSQIQPNFFLK